VGTGGAELGEPDTATVTITDNEGVLSFRRKEKSQSIQNPEQGLTK
jgi:hypothetical protein